MVDLAQINAWPTPALPCRITGRRWDVTVDWCIKAHLLRTAPGSDSSALPQATRAAHGEGGIVAWAAPDAWLMIGDAVAPSAAGYGVDVSARYVSLVVEREAVGFGVALTGLDADSLIQGRSLPTRLAGLPVLIVPRANQLLIFAERGRERYWIEWLNRMAQSA